MNFLSTISKSKIVLTAVAAFTLCLVVASPVMGATATDTFGIGEFGEQSTLGDSDIRSTIAQIINVALGLLGVVCVVLVLYAGFLMMTAAGNEEKVEKGKGVLVYALIGLAIILSAYAISVFFIGQLSDATNTGNVPGFEG